MAVTPHNRRSNSVNKRASSDLNFTNDVSILRYIAPYQTQNHKDMGIKGILKEIAPTKRIALSKLAVDHLQNERANIRIAIDVSIWKFQVQSGKGGVNPALRTFYYRLLSLLRLPISPLFVFDGPNKPPIKRNKSTITYSNYDVNKPTKDLLDLFGFPWHVAPGEAEAECANFQKHNVVDAVLSEDGDTLMFGSRLTLLNWSSEESKGKKPKTHVDLYDYKETKEKFGLDAAGMILVALMSGGDYITAGIPGCGPKVAIEAAKAGFGSDLCRLSPADMEAIQQWKARLRHELDTNESCFFKTKHKKLAIPEDFPNMEVLSYYTHPNISSPQVIREVEQGLVWDGDVDVYELRRYVAQFFNWTYRSGARWFLKGLAGPLLIHALQRRRRTALLYSTNNSKTSSEILAEERSLISGPDKERTAFENDGAKELRVKFVPADRIEINLDEEEEKPPGAQEFPEPDESDEDVDEVEEQASQAEQPPRKKPARNRATWNPNDPQELWVLEAILRRAAPESVGEWERQCEQKKLAPNRPRSKPKKPATVNRQEGAILNYVKSTKPRDATQGKAGMNHGAEKVPSSSQSTLISTPTKTATTHLTGCHSGIVTPRKYTTPSKRGKNKLIGGQAFITNYSTSATAKASNLASTPTKRKRPNGDNDDSIPSGEISVDPHSPLQRPPPPMSSGLSTIKETDSPMIEALSSPLPPSSSPLQDLHSLLGLK